MAAGSETGTDFRHGRYSITLKTFYLSLCLPTKWDCWTKIKHLLEATWTPIFPSHVPHSFWGDVVLTVCYLIKHIPSSIWTIKSLVKFYILTTLFILHCLRSLVLHVLLMVLVLTLTYCLDLIIVLSSSIHGLKRVQVLFPIFSYGIHLC